MVRTARSPEVIRWTKDAPTALGWYWFKHPDLNMGEAMPAWIYNCDRIARVKLMAVHGESQDKNLSDCAGEWSEAIEVPVQPPHLELPDRIKNRMGILKSEVEEILDGAFSILTTELPGPVQFEYVNAAPRDVLTDEERAQSFSFVTRYDHLPGECRLSAIEHDGQWDIENIDYLRYALNEFRSLIHNQKDSVHYQKIHNVWLGMFKLEDSTQGTTIRVFDTTGADVTEIFIRWLGEANKAIRYVVSRLEYGYLYNGILQHSDSEYSARFVEDYTSGELNYIMWKHALILDFIKDMLGRYYPVIKHLSYLRPGSL